MALKLLKNPEVRYGPLPGIEAARELLAHRLDLQVYEGAMEYLDLHLGRVQDCYEILSSSPKRLATIKRKIKARWAFINTTRALRMIMVFHRENPFVLNQMAIRIKGMPGQNGLKPHYEYLLRLLISLGSREAGTL